MNDSKQNQKSKSCFKVLIEDKHCRGKMIGFTENRIMVFYKADLLSLSNLFGFMGSVLAPSQRALNRFLSKQDLSNNNFNTGLPGLGVRFSNHAASSIAIASEFTSKSIQAMSNIFEGIQELGEQLSSLFDEQIETYYNADLETFSKIYGFIGSTLAPSQRALNQFLLGSNTVSNFYDLGLPGLGIRFTHQVASTISIATVATIIFAVPASALPSGAQVVSGDVTIQQSATVMDVNSASNKAIVNYDRFNVAGNETVNFNLPTSQSVILNRVVGSDPSAIFGKINSNGQVFLTNPNGILFARGSQVDTGSLFATTMNINNNDFLQGKYQFTQDENKGPASIINQGDINIATGGYAVLAGAAVDNQGNINAPLGHIELAVGQQVTMTVDENVNVNVTVDEKLKNQVATLQSAISNTGAIRAGGGIIKLQSELKDNLYDKAINNTGLIKADGLAFEGGRIKLIAEGQTVYNNGEITAVANNADEKGGDIQVLGKTVELDANSVIDASGNAGGGSILIGGDAHGANTEVLNATDTYVAQGAMLKADALQNGDGGKIVVWSDHNTYYGGNLSAKGAGTNGNGGFAEVSGKENLSFEGTADLSPGGEGGQYGELLLDPANIIVATGGSAVNSDVSTFTANAGTTQTIAPATLVALAANVTLQATNDITFTDALAMTSSGKTLTVQAGHDINVNAAVSTTNAAIAMTAGNNIVLNSTINSGASTLSLTADGTVNGVSGDGTGSITGTSTLTATSITLSSSQAVGTSSNRINTVATNLTVNNTNANAYVTNTGALNIAASNLGSGALDVSGTGNITLIGNITATGGVTLASTATNGTIALGTKTITATGSTVALTATGTGTITASSGSNITANTVNLTSASGAIGTSSAKILTTASNLSVTKSSGSSYVSNTGALTINSSNLGTGTLNVTGNNNITVAGAISANGTTLTATGNVAVNASITSSSTGGITLTADNSGTNSGNLTIGSSGSLATGNGNIVLKGSQMDIGGTVNSGTAQISFLTTYNKNIYIGNSTNSDSSSSWDLSSSELNKLTASTVIVNSGIYTNTNTMTLGGGGNITMNAAMILTNGGDIEATSPFALTTSGKAFSAISNNNINISDALTTNAGQITLTADKDADNIGNIAITSNGSLSTSGASITLKSAQIALAGSVNAGTSTVTLNTTTTKAINVGASTTNNDSSSIFDVDSSELSKITAGTLVIGSTAIGGGISTAGNITLASGTAGTTAGAYVLQFNNGDAATISHAITTNNKTFNAYVDQFKLTSTGSINSGSASTTIGTNSTNKAITIGGSTDDADTSGTGGILNISSAELGRITAGSLNIGNTAYSGGISTASDITLATGTAGTTAGAYTLNLYNSGAATIAHNINTAGQVFKTFTDQFKLTSTGSINTGSGSTYIYTNNTNKAITIGGSTDDADTSGTGGFLDISSAELARITAGTLTIGQVAYSGGISTTGNITFSNGTAGVTAGTYTLNLYNAGAETISHAINSSNNKIYFYTNQFRLLSGGSINTGSAQTAVYTISNQPISLGGFTDDADTGSMMNISNAELARITASVLQFGQINRSGGFTTLSDITLGSGTAGVDAGVFDINVYNGGDINISNNIYNTSRTLSFYGDTFKLTSSGSLYAGGNLYIGTNYANKAITVGGSTDDADTSGAGGILNISNAELARMSTAGYLNIGLTAYSGGLSTISDITVNNNLNFSNAGAVTIGNVINTNNHALVVYADQFKLTSSGSINTGTSDTTIGNNNTTKAITFGGTTDDADTSGSGGILDISAAELARITASTVNLGNTSYSGGITSTGNLVMANGTPGVTAGTYNLYLKNASSIALNHNINVGNNTFTANGSSLSQQSGTSVTAGNIAITTTSGNIGSSGTHVTVNTSGLSTNSTSGSAYITNSNTGTTTLNASNMGSGNIDYTGSGALTFADNVNVNSASFITPGNITINAGKTITASGSGHSIILASTGNNFYNNAGSATLSATSGNWVIYAKSPSTSVLGGLSGQKLYNRSYNSTPASSLSSANWILFNSENPSVVTANTQSNTINVIRFYSRSDLPLAAQDVMLDFRAMHPTIQMAGNYNSLRNVDLNNIIFDEDNNIYVNISTTEEPRITETSRLSSL